MIIEFVMNFIDVMLLLKNRLTALEICFSQTFSVNGEECLLDHIEFGFSVLRNAPTSDEVEISLGGGNSTFVPWSKVEIEQPVTLFITKLSELEQANADLSLPSFQPQVKLYFNLVLTKGKGSPTLCLAFSHIDLGPLDALIDEEAFQQIETFLMDRLDSTCSTLDLAPINRMLGHETTVVNAGVVARFLESPNDNEPWGIAIRLEVDSVAVDAENAWTEFFSGASDQTGPFSWELFIDKELIVPAVVRAFTESLNQVDPAQFDIEVWPQGLLVHEPSIPDDDLAGVPLELSGSQPNVVVTFSGEAVDACPTFVPSPIGPIYIGMTDVDVEVYAIVSLRVVQPNEVQTTTLFFWDVSNWEVLNCAIGAAFFWPAVGSILLAEEKINWGQFFLGGGAPISRFIATIAAASTEGPPGNFTENLPGTCEQVADFSADMAIVCTQPLSFGEAPLLGQIILENIQHHRSNVGLLDGVSLSGSLSEIPNITPATLEVDVSDFAWSTGDPCGSSSTEGQGAGLKGRANVILKNTGGASLTVCHVSVLEDPLNQFTPYLSVNFAEASQGGWFEADVVMSIPNSGVLQEYLEAPYPCKLLIQTNGGARLITIPPFEQLSQEDAFKMYMEWSNAKANCYEWMDEWAQHGLFNPKWLIDPPQDRVVAHLWQVVVAGLTPGEMVSLKDARGEIVSTANGTRSGVAQLSALITPSQAGQELTILKGGESMSHPMQGHLESPIPSQMHKQQPRHVLTHTQPQSRNQLSINQILLVEEGTLRLGAPCLQLTAAPFEGVPALYCITPLGLNVYDITVPAFANLIHQELAPSLRGGLGWSTGIVAWGDAGFQVCRGAELPTRLKRPVRTLACNRKKAVLNVVRFARHLYALTEDAVEIYDRELKRLGRLPMKDARHIGLAGSVLAVSNERGIELYDIGQPERPTRAGFYEVVDVAGLMHPTMIDVRNSVFIQNAKGGGSLLDLSRADQPQALAHFAQEPWFVGAARVGKRFARLDRSRTFLTLYTVRKILTPAY